MSRMISANRTPLNAGKFFAAFLNCVSPTGRCAGSRAGRLYNSIIASDPRFTFPFRPAAPVAGFDSDVSAKACPHKHRMRIDRALAL
jgi:hypothetical protein